MDQSNVDLTIKSCIEIYQNDFNCGYEGQDKTDKAKVFTELIISLVRYRDEIRYCSDNKCPCSPETSIRAIYVDNREFFEKMLGRYALTECNPIKARQVIEEIITKTFGIEALPND